MAHSARFQDAKPGKTLIARAIACGIVLLALPACGIPPRRIAEPGPGLPTTFNGVTSQGDSGQLAIDEFYRDPLLLCLIDQALANNRDLKILNEDVQIARNEILARSGAYLPFLTAGPTVGLDRPSNRTIEGAAIRDEEFLPGKFFDNPHANYLLGVNFTWQLDIYRQLRNARDAAYQRYVAAVGRRDYFVTRLVADVAENYFRLMALDKRLENLNQIIEFQEQSLRVARARKEAARDTELAVLRFEAEVRRNQSEKLIVYQDIIEVENRINFLANRFPQNVGRDSAAFYDLNINTLALGVPSQLLQNRPDIRRAERELAASGLDVRVARANFYPQLILNAGVGLQSFNITYLFEPQAVVGNIAAGFIGPLVNRRAIRAEYMNSNARQMQAVYDYQRTILDAFTEVVNRMTMAQNYSNSVAIKKQQLASLQEAVSVANSLFEFARTEYLDVLTAQRDLRDARTALIDTKEQQLISIVNTYQALGGGTFWSAAAQRGGVPAPAPSTIHTVRPGETFDSIARLYYKSSQYTKALWAANKQAFPDANALAAGDRITIPPINQLDPASIEQAPGIVPPLPGAQPGDEPPVTPGTPSVPPPANEPGPFGRPRPADLPSDSTPDATG